MNSSIGRGKLMDRNKLEQDIRNYLNSEAQKNEPPAEWWNKAVSSATGRERNPIIYFFNKNRIPAPVLLFLAMLLVGGVIYGAISIGGEGYNPGSTTEIVSNPATTDITDTTTKTTAVGGPESLPWVFQGIVSADSPGTQEVEIILDTELPPDVETLPVYSVITPEVNDEYAWSIAQKFGFDEDDAVPFTGENRKVYSYRNDNGTLEIETDGYISFYSDYDSSKPEYLPTNEECIAIATEWLESCDMYPDNVTSTKVSTFIEIESYNTDTKASEKYVLAKSVSFSVALNDYGYSSSVYVVVGDQGKIIKAGVDCVEFQEYTTVDIISAEEAIDILEGNLEVTQETGSDAPICLVNYNDIDQLTITSIAIQYYIGAGNYAQPVYVIKGIAAYEGWDGTDDFVGRVDAVVRD
jgi:hypothetical protein